MHVTNHAYAIGVRVFSMTIAGEKRMPRSKPECQAAEVCRYDEATETRGCEFLSGRFLSNTLEITESNCVTRVLGIDRNVRACD